MGLGSGRKTCQLRHWLASFQLYSRVNKTFRSCLPLRWNRKLFVDVIHLSRSPQPLFCQFERNKTRIMPAICRKLLSRHHEFLRNSSHLGGVDKLDVQRKMFTEGFSNFVYSQIFSRNVKQPSGECWLWKQLRVSSHLPPPRLTLW